MLRTRSQISHEGSDGRSARFCRRLGVLLAYLAPEKLVAFEAMGGEIDPRRIVDAYAASGVSVFLPYWQDGASKFVCLRTGMSFVDDDQRVVILVPGIAFDCSGGRLGRGGGWYDRVLEEHPHAIRIGCGYDEEVIDQVPRDPWDAVMHHVVTDARSIAVDQLVKPAAERAYERT